MAGSANGTVRALNAGKKVGSLVNQVKQPALNPNVRVKRNWNNELVTLGHGKDTVWDVSNGETVKEMKKDYY